MKYVLAALFFFYTISANAQVAPPTDETEFIKADVAPTYPGGLKAWSTYLTTSPLMRKAAQKAGKKLKVGTYTVHVRFLIEIDGSVSEALPLNKIGHGLENDAAEVIKKSGKWNPGQHNGRPVRAYNTQPIVFAVTKD